MKPKPPSDLSPEQKRRLLAEKLRARADRAYAELPLSDGQRALWFVHQLAPESPAYHVIFAAKIHSTVDVPALEAAFQGLVDRHPVLRSTFPLVDGEPVARIEKKLQVPFERVDASGWTEEQLTETLRRETERPFDLMRSPPLRVRFYDRASDPCVVATIHHIVMDGWSLWVCLAELSELYRAAREGRDADLAEPRAGLRDALRWHSELLASPEGERQRSYWLRQLGGEIPLLNLPVDKPRPRTQRFRGASHRFDVDDASASRLRALAQAEGATLQMALFALFQLLLFRHTGQTEFPVGTLSSGRTRAELEDVVGYLANPLVLRSSIDPTASFRRLLKRTREAMLDAFDHQDYPFPRLVEALAPDRDSSLSPLFQVLFVFEKPQRLEQEGVAAFIVGETRRVTLGDLEVSPLPFTAQHEGQFDLILLLTELDGKLYGYFDYNEDLFERKTITRLVERFHVLIGSAVNGPDVPVGELDLLSDAETGQLEVWNQTSFDYAPACLHEMFEAQVARAPDAPAAVFEDQTLSYRELNLKANALAHRLGALGVTLETPVALCMHRSLDLIVGMLAILKAGGVYVPIDPDYPATRRSFMLEDAAAPVLLTRASTGVELPGYDGHVVRLDDEAEIATLATFPATNPETVVEPSNLAYVIYTSGSTGKPKGVLVEHRGLATLSGEQKRLFGVGPGWRVLQFSSISFDASVFEMVMALASGGSLHLGDRATLMPGRPLLEKLASERIHIVTLPPSALVNLPVEPLPDLRVVTVAGEACPGEVVERWASGRRFFNLYGPTEATIWSTFAECTEPEPWPPIGRPIANTRTYVLDASGREVPIGVPGELYVGGIGLARGYLNRPELTAEKFVSRPAVGADGSRLYRTGDLVRRRADGDIEFMGRLDFQVKVRGFRIELGELESVLASHPAVNEVCVVKRGDGADESLVAYVVPGDARPIPATELREFLKRRLPQFMVPAAFVSLDAFPLTASGKIDRSSLPAPEQLARAEAAVVPVGELEESIASVWRELLHRDDVGVQDNFFEMGGNSLLIARANTKLERLLGRAVPIVDMFRFPTIRELARRLGDDPVESSGAPDDAGSSSASRESLESGRRRLLQQGRRRARENEKAGS